jgi:hypothetical protein
VVLVRARFRSRLGTPWGLEPRGSCWELLLVAPGVAGGRAMALLAAGPPLNRPPPPPSAAATASQPGTTSREQVCLQGMLATAGEEVLVLLIEASSSAPALLPTWRTEEPNSRWPTGFRSTAPRRPNPEKVM